MILVVDDNADTAEALAKLLANVGPSATCAVDGPGALSIMATVRPEAVVLDSHMPGMSGVEVLREMRSRSTLADVPVVMYSAYPDADAIRAARDLGAADWLVKGCDEWGDVLQAIADALKGATTAVA
ncbi:MAG TPA: response regulator [Tepidisphaeraceae bacterium]|nr:response regulator [Tepidisphaeraceae bacterium]